jgi:hypothetical protein
MIKKLIVCLSLACLSCGASEINREYRDKIVSAIWKIEGGAKTKYPYGIKSIDTKGNIDKARKICENTVANNFLRFQRLKDKTEYHCFLDFLASRYCPKSCDPVGNRNWVKNIHSMIR